MLYSWGLFFRVARGHWREWPPCSLAVFLMSLMLLTSLMFMMFMMFMLFMMSLSFRAVLISAARIRKRIASYAAANRSRKVFWSVRCRATRASMIV